MEGRLKTLVYDGGCPFCKAFALRSELKGGVPDLQIRDGRLEEDLRKRLRRRGFKISEGAILIDGDQIWHGSEAIAVLCQQLKPSDPLLELLNKIFGHRKRAKFLYPGLLAARQFALTLKGLPVDPDRV